MGRAVGGAVRPVRVRAVMVRAVVLGVATEGADGAMVPGVAAGGSARKAPSVRASVSSRI